MKVKLFSKHIPYGPGENKMMINTIEQSTARSVKLNELISHIIISQLTGIKGLKSETISYVSLDKLSITECLNLAEHNYNNYQEFISSRNNKSLKSFDDLIIFGKRLKISFGDLFKHLIDHSSSHITNLLKGKIEPLAFSNYIAFTIIKTV